MKNWKTTAAGLIGGIAPLVVTWLQGGTFDIKTLITCVATAIMGILAKDYNISGAKA